MIKKLKRAKQPSTISQGSTFQQTNFIGANFNMQAHSPSEDNFTPNHITMETASDLLLSQLFSKAPCMDNQVQPQRTLFNQSAGKRSPQFDLKASSFLEFEKAQVKDSQLHSQQKVYSPKNTDFNQIFQNLPQHHSHKQQLNRQILSQDCANPKRKGDKKSKEIFQKQKTEEAKIFLRYLKARRTHHKTKQIKIKVFNTMNPKKNHLYHNRYRENVIKSEQINETIPNKFEDKQLREQEQKSESLQDQTITDSQPPFQFQAPAQSEKLEEFSNLECREPSFINPLTELHSHIRQPSRQPSQESNRSMQSSTGSEESQLFRIFQGLRVITVNTNQQPPSTQGSPTVRN